MSTVNPRARRLESEYRELRSAFDADDNVEIVAMGPAPSDKYRIIFKVPSLRLDAANRPVKVMVTIVDIELPQGYPRVPPIAKTILDDNVFHPNFSQQKICLQDHWAPARQLVDTIKEISAMLQWQKFNIASPLNAAAAEWSQTHAHEIPLSNIEIGINTAKIRQR